MFVILKVHYIGDVVNRESHNKHTFLPALEFITAKKSSTFMMSKLT